MKLRWMPIPWKVQVKRAACGLEVRCGFCAAPPVGRRPGPARHALALHTLEIRPESPFWRGCSQQPRRHEAGQDPPQVAAQIAAVIYAGVGGVDEIGMLGVRIAVQSQWVRQQRQVGHGGGQVELEFGLGTAEVPGLSHPQPDQPGQPVSGHHPPAAILLIGWASNYPMTS